MLWAGALPRNEAPRLFRFIHLFEDRLGDLWATLETGEIVRRHQGRFTTYTLPQRLSNSHGDVLGDDGQGNLLIHFTQVGNDVHGVTFHQFSQHVVRWLDGQFQSADELRPSFSPLSLNEDGNSASFSKLVEGDFWIATHQRAVRLKNGGGIQFYTERNVLPGTRPGLIWGKQHPLQAVSHDAAGRLWLTDLKSMQSQLLSLQTPEGFDVYCGYADNEGNYWIGTFNNRLFRARQQTVMPYTKAQGLNVRELSVARNARRCALDQHGWRRIV